MATVEQVTRASYQGRFDDQMSAGADAAANSMKRLGATVAETDEKVTRATRSADSWLRSADPMTAASQRLSRAQQQQAAAQQALNVEIQAGGERQVAAERALAALAGRVQKAKDDLNALRMAYASAGDASARMGVQASSFAVANDNAARSSGNLRAALGQAGFQVQDFATQVSMGQNALMAFGVQGAQLAGVFGPTGAIAGAALMVGVIAAQLLLGKSAADAFTDSMTRQADALKVAEEDARRYREGITDEARQVRELIEYYGTLSQARQSQEMRQFRRDQADLLTAQDTLRGDALGSTSGLSRAFQSQLAEAQMLAERNYGRNSAEYGLIVSNPDLQRMREFVAVVEGFRETGDVSREALARLYEQMVGLADGSDVVSRRIRAQAEVIDGLTGKARDAEQAQAALSARAQALGLNVDTTATAAERLNRQLAAMARYDQGITDNLSQEIGRLQREFAAASVGAERLREVRAQLAREDRLDRLVSDRQKELERQGITGEAVTTNLAEFRTQAEATLDRVGRLQEGIRTLEEGFRGAGRGAREASQEFADLRRHTSGLLVATTGDVRAAEEILRTIRGTQADPAVRQRAEAEAARIAEREADRRQAEADRFTQSWGDRIASETTRGLFEGTKNGESAAQRFGNMLRNILTSAVSAALSRNVVQPIIGTITGGNSAQFSLPFAGGGAAVTADGGSTQGALNQAGQLAGLRTAGGFGNLGNAFTGQGLANTGLGFVDSALNTPIYGTGAAFQGPTLSGAPLAGVDGLTVAGGLGGALGIAGGAYGVYSGVQRGGLGGYTQAAGGALTAGLSAAIIAGLSVPVAGWIAAAALAIGGALLPGAKPSGQGQLARTNLANDALSFEGLGGSRFSQGNRDAATNAVGGISALVKEIGDKLGGARIGGNAAVGVTNGTLYLEVGAQKAQFANDEAGAKQLGETAARFVLEEFRRQGVVGGDYAGILNASGTPEALAENLNWYDQVYKQIIASTPAVSAYEKAIEGVWQQFEPAIQKARELSIATDELTRAREDEYRRVYLERERQVKLFDDDVFIRTLRAQGNVYADMLAFDAALPAQLKEIRTSLEALGLSAEDVSTRISQVEYAAGLERLNIIKAAQEAETLATQQAAEARVQSAQKAAEAIQAGAGGATAAIRNLEDYVVSLTTTKAGGGTAMDRLEQSQRRFNAIYGAAAAGDANSISGLAASAEAYRTAASEVFGTGQGFAEALQLITDRIGALGDLGSETLTQSFIAENARENTDRIVDANADLKQEIAALRASLELLLSRPAA